MSHRSATVVGPRQQLLGANSTPCKPCLPGMASCETRAAAGCAASYHLVQYACRTAVLAKCKHASCSEMTAHSPGCSLSLLCRTRTKHQNVGILAQLLHAEAEIVGAAAAAAIIAAYALRLAAAISVSGCLFPCLAPAVVSICHHRFASFTRQSSTACG